MRGVLVSIQPNWCELIAKGILIPANDNKTVEVRKTRPQIDTPFKCFIYCTKNGAGLLQTVYVPMHVVGRGYNNIKLACYKDYNHVKDMHDCVNGKVIGEFICDKIYEIRNLGSRFMIGDDIALTNRIAKESCLHFDEMKKYLCDKDGYAWHITDLKIYDKPKELGEFNGFKKCIQCKESGYESSACIHDDNCMIPVPLTRPPQSWCYVEDNTL